jgi:hypothetical protein
MEEPESNPTSPQSNQPPSQVPAPDVQAPESLEETWPAEEAPEAERTPLQLRRRRHRPRREWRFAQAFWTVTSLLSLVVNVILVVALLALGRQLFTLKGLVEDQVLGGLYKNFILMDQAHIKTTIPVSAQVPAKFDLPLKTNTVVVLTEDTVLDNARVAKLTTGGLTIDNAPATIVLSAGTRLPVALDLTVPVDQMIPVNLTVGVDIPLTETELHEPFVGLQEVVRPYYRMVGDMPDNWGDLICGPQPTRICAWIFVR